MRLPLTIKPCGVASTYQPALQDRSGRAFDGGSTKLGEHAIDDSCPLYGAWRVDPWDRYLLPAV